MFIPYHSPSEDRRKWRRVINSFTAEKAAQKRPVKTPEVSLGSFVEWTDPEHNNAERISQSLARNGRLRTKRPAARQKVYRMTSMGRRLPEPLGSWALSYCEYLPWFDFLVHTLLKRSKTLTLSVRTIPGYSAMALQAQNLMYPLYVTGHPGTQSPGMGLSPLPCAR
jgi:hypothetical protein